MGHVARKCLECRSTPTVSLHFTDIHQMVQPHAADCFLLDFSVIHVLTY